MANAPLIMSASTANCGIYGLRPTAELLPRLGMKVIMIWDGVRGTAGPMAHSSRDIALFMQSVLATEPALKDPALAPILWKTPAGFGLRKLKVGIMLCNGVVQPHPPIRRAMQLALKKLEASKEVEVVPCTPYKHDHGYDIIVRRPMVALSQLNCAHSDNYSSPMVVSSSGRLARTAEVRSNDRFTACHLRCAEDILSLTQWATSAPHCRDHTASDIVQLQAAREAYRRQHSDHWRCKLHSI